MGKIRDKLKEKPHLVLSVPAILCFLTFITNIIASLKDGNVDSNELHPLLSIAYGFETVVLAIIMLALRDKK